MSAKCILRPKNILMANVFSSLTLLDIHLANERNTNETNGVQNLYRIIIRELAQKISKNIFTVNIVFSNTP